MKAVINGNAGDVNTFVWQYVRCSSSQFAVITNGDSIVCQPCKWTLGSLLYVVPIGDGWRALLPVTLQ